MYNRYILNDHGGYTRIQEEERREAPPDHREPESDHRREPPPRPNPPPEPECRQPPPDAKGGGAFTDGLTGFLRHILDQFHLDNVDTGDLLLLLLLFLLFKEEADEELLFALGLLLIL
ncbi:MAG: hypothetical protein RR288_03285 [Oscillibacter sp.]